MEEEGSGIKLFVVVGSMLFDVAASVIVVVGITEDMEISEDVTGTSVEEGTLGGVVADSTAVEVVAAEVIASPEVGLAGNEDDIVGSVSKLVAVVDPKIVLSLGRLPVAAIVLVDGSAITLLDTATVVDSKLVGILVSVAAMLDTAVEERSPLGVSDEDALTVVAETVGDGTDPVLVGGKVSITEKLLVISVDIT